MHRFRDLFDRDAFVAVGLMSGTSMDGVDAALVTMSAEALRPDVRVPAFVSVPYPPALREQLAGAAAGEPLRAEDIARLHTSVAVAFAGAFHEVCRRTHTDPGEVHFIGSHGQTVAHAPPGGGEGVAGTLQLGPPAMIAALTGVTTVGDFRSGDVALGGHGAPLCAWPDFVLRRSDDESRVVLNIGGIANVTVLPRGCAPSEVIAFDTGPGNMVVDALVRAFDPDGPGCDENGERAARGVPSPSVLEAFLEHPFFALEPPRSAGHREFGPAFAWQLLARAEAAGLSRDDTIATATALTVQTIADAFERFVRPRCDVDAVYVGGGGRHNRTLMAWLRERLGDVDVRDVGELGIPGDAREAVDFALMARETILGRPNVLAQVTGATRARVLGTIAPGGPA